MGWTSRLAGLISAIGVATGASAGEPAADYPEREFAVATYLWGAGLDGSIEADSVSTDVDASFSDILDQLNVGAMVAAGARWGRFVALFDGMWMELEEEVDRGAIQVGPATLGPAEIDAVTTEGIGDLKLGYRLLEPTKEQPISFDLLAGARYWYLRSEIDADFALLADRSVDESQDWVDAVVGARLIVELTPDLSIVLMGDVGGWDVGSASHQTWQLMGMLGLQLSDAWSLRAGYRALRIERDLAEFDMRGPILGAVYRF